MKYLVDTHILLWSFIEPEQLSKNVKIILLDENNDIYYSPINLWEISIKYSLKKLDLKGLKPEEFFEELDNSYYLCKEINNPDIITNYHLPLHHKDPFDRFLVWEAIRNDFVLITVDGSINEYKNDGLRTVN
ncbi:PilT protein domain protein [Treponema primitia ZAS-2]|uniref:PilT protein domain protein n=1 Tax=Treponema primitia (strain ATCC BAA-887 / DSM 12427 / ZAS-2) TaxID=545694 RepID=F5YMD4_TREPZ|nr:type II toxin-antitoxin system VapC family toxin [Treponema primitia]AEF84088.1 PilT protein domain protein [Treponema primitia ZAS-2]